MYKLKIRYEDGIVARHYFDTYEQVARKIAQLCETEIPAKQLKVIKEYNFRLYLSYINA